MGAERPSVPLCYDSPGKIKFCDKQVATWETPGPLVSILAPLFSLKCRFDGPLTPAPPSPRRIGGPSLAPRWNKGPWCPSRMQGCPFLNVAQKRKKAWNWDVAEMVFQLKHVRVCLKETLGDKHMFPRRILLGFCCFFLPSSLWLTILSRYSIRHDIDA